MKFLDATGITALVTRLKTYFAQKSEIPTKTSDLTNDSGFITDDKYVDQMASGSSSATNWRPIMIGWNSGNTETYTPSTTNNKLLAFTEFKVQPSTGTLKATTFKGDLTGTASGNLTSDSTLDRTKLSGVSSSGTTKFLRQDGSWQVPNYPPDMSSDVSSILTRMENFSIVTIVCPNGSTVVNFNNSTRALLVVGGYSVGTKSMHIVTCTASGVMSVADVHSGTNISYTTGTRSMTISNNSTASSAYAHFICFSGSVFTTASGDS